MKKPEQARRTARKRAEPIRLDRFIWQVGDIEFFAEAQPLVPEHQPEPSAPGKK